MTLLCVPPDFFRGRRTVRSVLAAIACCLLALPAVISAAETSDKKTFDIPASDAAAALKRFSAQSGTQVIYPERELEGTRTKALKGAFTPAEALDRLLAGSNLRAAHDKQSGAFAVSRAPVSRMETHRPNG